MRTTTHRYSVDGDRIRVVVAGDVIALPEEGWSCGGFGTHIVRYRVLELIEALPAPEPR